VKPSVALVRCPDYDALTVRTALDRAMDLIGGLAPLGLAGRTVLVKPNVLSPKAPEEAVTTHPSVVEAVCALLAGAGATVRCGDSSGGSVAGRSPTGRALEVSGIAAAARRAGAEVLSFETEGPLPLPHPRDPALPPYHLARAAVEADVVVTLPKLKTHALTLLTGAVKNLFGCVPGVRKAHYHAAEPSVERFSGALVDIYQLLRPGLAIMDAVLSMEGNGPGAGTPRHTGYLLVSYNGVAVDTVAAHLMGVDPRAVPTTRLAAARGLGPDTLDGVELVGDSLREARAAFAGFELPALAGARLARSGRVPAPIMRAAVGLLKSRPRADRKLCTGCRLCLDSCPVQAIAMTGRAVPPGAVALPVIDYGRCIECLCCHELCPRKAMALVNVSPLAGAALALYERLSQERRGRGKNSPSRHGGGTKS
jgi:uncharacterized protein (DUF362 family)/ferredoxin